MASCMHRRLLQDIEELQNKPYPNITLYTVDKNIFTACLVLTVDNYGAMHCTVDFGSDYPLTPPRIRMDSKVTHPNIKEAGHICASILDTEMDYTPAYTLKGIAIQLLSFFSSDRIQQVGGDFSFELQDFKDLQLEQSIDTPVHICETCRFGAPDYTSKKIKVSDETIEHQAHEKNTAASNSTSETQSHALQKAELPEEMLLLICDLLETEDLLSFAEAWPTAAATTHKFNLIRTREIQCFCLKESYLTAKLGVGVAITKEEKGNMDWVGSEFDIISEEAFNLGVRRSVQGIPFEFWLPLPISEVHYERIKDDIDPALAAIAQGRNYGDVASEFVVIKMLNDVIIKLSKNNEKPTYMSPIYPYEETAKSTLTHASEKAMLAYFHLLHLLLCKALEEPDLITHASNLVRSFTLGDTSKEHVSNVGHLLVHTLIADVEIPKKFIQNLITETITRNALRILQLHPELAYFEPTAVSDYRLQKTFDACKTSCRILMFLNLFRKVAIGNPRKTIQQLRDNAFERHGAPPPGGALYLAESIRNIHKISNFRDFFITMEMPVMDKAWFTNFLKQTMKDAINRGYCAIPFTPAQAMSLRREKEPNIEVTPGLLFLYTPKPEKDGKYNFSANQIRGGESAGEVEERAVVDTEISSIFNRYA